MSGEEKRLALNIKNAKNGRFCTIKYQNFQGSMPRIPLESSRFGQGSGQQPLNFRTEVYSLWTQVQTALGKTLKAGYQTMCNTLGQPSSRTVDFKQQERSFISLMNILGWERILFNKSQLLQGREILRYWVKEYEYTESPCLRQMGTFCCSVNRLNQRPVGQHTKVMVEFRAWSESVRQISLSRLLARLQGAKHDQTTGI